jgi:hypothetical protein
MIPAKKPKNKKVKVKVKVVKVKPKDPPLTRGPWSSRAKVTDGAFLRKGGDQQPQA